MASYETIRLVNLLVVRDFNERGIAMYSKALVLVAAAVLGGATSARGVEWVVESVDPNALLQAGAGLALASDGTPHIVYHHKVDSSWELRHAYKLGSTWLTETIETSPRGGDRAVIEIDGQDRLHIAYNFLNHGGSGGQVKYGLRDASGWTVQEVNPSSIHARIPRIDLDADGKPHLAFIDNGGTLFASHYATFDGSSWVIETVGPTGLQSCLTCWDIALDSAGIPNIVGRISSSLYLATRSGGVWSLEYVGRGGHEASIVLDQGDHHMIGHAVLNDDDLRFAAKEDGAWSNEVVLNLGPGAKGPSLALDAEGNPRMTFETDVDGSGHTLVQHAYLEGSDWIIDLVDSEMAVQSGTSLAVSDDGLSHVVYIASGEVRYASAFIPEPATMLLLCGAAVPVLLKRRRKR